MHIIIIWSLLTDNEIEIILSRLAQQNELSSISGWLWIAVLLLVILIVWALLIFQSNSGRDYEITADLEMNSTVPGDSHFDDLTVIEGIGPKIADLLEKEGITTYNQLATTEPGVLRKLLTDAGLRLPSPESWPEQARLAASGDFAELNAFKNQLKAGRRSTQSTDE
jgi:hypothetical protein